MNNLSTSDIYTKVQSSCFALFPHLFLEAVAQSNTPNIQQSILEEDLSLAKKAYGTQHHQPFFQGDINAITSHRLFPNGIRFDVLNYPQLLNIFINHKTLSTHIVQYFDPFFNENHSDVFLSTKAQLLLEYNAFFQSNPTTSQHIIYTYNHTNAIYDLLAFLNFFNTTADTRFKAEIHAINAFVINALYGTPHQDNITPTQGSSHPTPQPLIYQPKRKLPPQNTPNTKRPKNLKKKFFLLVTLAIFLGIVLYVAFKWHSIQSQLNQVYNSTIEVFSVFTSPNENGQTQSAFPQLTQEPFQGN